MFENVLAYERLIGRYGRALGEAFVDAVDVEPGDRVLDVGCGTGALTAVLAERLGPGLVAGVDPSPVFVDAARERIPGAAVIVGTAEELPFEADSFDVALSQLVFHFVSDPERAATELRRVVRPGGRTAACVWDIPGGMRLLTGFWDAAEAALPHKVAEKDERRSVRFTRRGELAALWRAAGFADVHEGELVVAATYASFDDVWEPFEAGVGPSGALVASLDHAERDAVRRELASRLDPGVAPFELSARAWYAAGAVP